MAESPKDSPAYEAQKKRTLIAQREQSAAGREIGPLPTVVDPDRRARGLADSEFFYKTYLAERFSMSFGSAHRKAIGILDECIYHGGLNAFAMPRGFGKSTLTEAALIKAKCYGLRLYSVFIGATDDLSSEFVSGIRKEFEQNELLLEDFPEICYPIRKLEGITQRARGQTLGGVATQMEFSDGHLVFPTVAGSKSSGSIIQSFGLTGSIRGLRRRTPSGKMIRPDFVIIDDAQTRESSKSPMQTDDREKIILGDILGLAGPKTKIAAVFLCTPIYPNDLTERFISRDRHPEWRGTRTQMVEAMPARMDLWEQYFELRRESLRAGDSGEPANEFYQENREAMDDGSVLSWPDRVRDGDLSALQSAMNMFCDSPNAFRTEYQCEPESAEHSSEVKQLDAATISKRFSGVDRFEVPPSTTRLTAFMDVHGELIFYSVIAWNEQFGGQIVDYGTYPRQTSSMFTLADPRPGLKVLHPEHTDEQRVYEGLVKTIPLVLGRPYVLGETPISVDRCLIDAGWHPDAVRQAIQQSEYANIIYPSKGIGRSATSAGIAKWKSRAGERSGHHWRLTLGIGGKGRLLQFDPDTWKSIVFAGLTVPMGGRSAIKLFGTAKTNHELFAEHLAAEYAKPVEKKGDAYDKWLVMPGRSENHWFDCVTGCAVAASVAGLTMNPTAEPITQKPPAPRRKFSDIQREKLAKAGA